MNRYLLNAAVDTFHRPADRPRFHGADIVRMGSLARRFGIQRWKRNPSGTGRNVDLLRLGLRSHHLAVYAPSANAEVGDSGYTATGAALALIHADDVVVIVDLDNHDGWSIAAGQARTESPEVPESLISKFRGDRVRAAVEHDAVEVAKVLILPRLSLRRSTGDAA